MQLIKYMKGSLFEISYTFFYPSQLYYSIVFYDGHVVEIQIHLTEQKARKKLLSFFAEFYIWTGTRTYKSTTSNSYP